MIFGLASALAADTIYFENLNSATPAQSLTAPPLNWTPTIYGDVHVGSPAHTG